MWCMGYTPLIASSAFPPSCSFWGQRQPPYGAMNHLWFLWCFLLCSAARERQSFHGPVGDRTQSHSCGQRLLVHPMVHPGVHKGPRFHISNSGPKDAPFLGLGLFEFIWVNMILRVMIGKVIESQGKRLHWMTLWVKWLNSAEMRTTSQSFGFVKQSITKEGNRAIYWSP